MGLDLLRKDRSASTVCLDGLSRWSVLISALIFVTFDTNQAVANDDGCTAQKQGRNGLLAAQVRKALHTVDKLATLPSDHAQLPLIRILRESMGDPQ